MTRHLEDLLAPTDVPASESKHPWYYDPRYQDSTGVRGRWVHSSGTHYVTNTELNQCHLADDPSAALKKFMKKKRKCKTVDE